MNMEPVAWIDAGDLRSVTNGNAVWVHPTNQGRMIALYTETQLNQARADALREAADEFGKRWTQSAKVQQELRRMADEVANVEVRGDEQGA